ncbi:MAG: PilZ domain-containing protein [Leptospiraceae bacterium]|nr:PilZ domain-containing protein [Leptospiraceae bacterium]
MNSEIRKADRIFPKDFADYAVQLHTSGENFSGYLGNISETGLCAIMPASFQPEVNEMSEGSVLHWPTGDNMEVAGRIAWKRDYEFQKKPHTMIGMEFSRTITFPEYLLALSLSVGDD